MAVDPVSLAITAAMMAATMAITASQKIYGPRLDDLSVTLSEYGTPIPRFWGMRRFDVPIIWAEKLREKKKQNKTKGGKYTEYRYFGTWAVAIADHEIEAVTRIWMDKHLVYQRTREGPISGASVLYEYVTATNRAVKIMNGQNMRIYLGTETQEPDPRMEAWCEDRYGADSCPAYRGVSYIVFEDLPLEKFGNRIPQITVEAVSAKSDGFPFETRSPATTLYGAQFSPDYNLLVVTDTDYTEFWDVPSRTRIANARTDVRNEGIGVTAGGTVYAVEGFVSQTLVMFGISGVKTTLTSTFDAVAWGCQYVGGVVCLYPFGLVSPQALYYNGEKVTYFNPGFTPAHYFEDVEGQAWAVGALSSGPGVGFCTMPYGTNAFTVVTADTSDAYAFDNGEGQYVVHQNSKLYLVNKDTHAIDAGPVAAAIGSSHHIPFRNVAPGAASIWLDNKEYSTTDLSVIRTVTFANWTALDVDDALYDPVNHALITHPSVILNNTWRYLDRIDNAGVTLEDIVEDVADWCGLADIDASDLDQTVLGYSVTQGSGKDMIAPLLDIHDSDARPHDFGVQFLKRGDASTGTLLTENFVREGDEDRYVVPIAQDTDLIRKLTVTFADEASDQQINTVIAQRVADAVDSVREQTIDLGTYAGVASDMQKYADRFLRREWISRETIQLGLTAQNLALEPADIKTVSLDGVTRIARCTKVTLSGGALRTEWVRDDPAIAVLGTGTGSDMDGRDPEVIFIPSMTKGFAIDIPLVEDADNSVNPVIYYAAGSYTGTNWPGAVFWKSDADQIDFDENWNAVDSASGAIWGTATGALANANPWLWDRGNTVEVLVYNGELTSTTEAAINADPMLNLIYLGQELLNFTTATLTGTNGAANVYTISGLRRGRRGTEWATSLHAANEYFIMASALINQDVGASEIGETLHFKPQTLGRDVEGAEQINLEIEGNSLKPYSPVHPKGTLDHGTNDWLIDWQRRTRVGGSWNGSAIALGETSEAYEVDIMDGPSVVRTISTSSSFTTYTSAQQTTDFGSPQSSISAVIYQMSSVVGRGYPTAATF